MKTRIELHTEADLLQRLDLALAREHARERSPHTKSRAALISHLFAGWLSTLTDSENEAASSAPAPAPVSHLPPWREPMVLRRFLYDTIETEVGIGDWLRANELFALTRAKFPGILLRDLKDELILMTRQRIIDFGGAKGYSSNTDWSTKEPAPEALRPSYRRDLALADDAPGVVGAFGALGALPRANPAYPRGIAAARRRGAGPSPLRIWT